MLHKSDHCLNCGEPTPDQFCARCGQKNTQYLVSFRELVEELISELLQLDSRIGRTIVPFLFQPGKLTNEFAAGRRVKYSSPLRLYLLTSVAYFFVLSLLAPVYVNVNVPPAETGAPSVTTATWDNLERLSPADRKQFIHQETAGLSDYGFLGNQLRAKIDELGELGAEKIDQKLSLGISNKMPKAMFFLLPLFALILKVLFLGSKRYYIEHFVFALHFHSFCFVVLLIPALLPSGPFSSMATIGIVVYLLVALHRVYGRSWLSSIAKYMALLASYGTLLGLSVATLIILTILF